VLFSSEFVPPLTPALADETNLVCLGIFNFILAA
jgi:hypothetical protein